MKLILDEITTQPEKFDSFFSSLEYSDLQEIHQRLKYEGFHPDEWVLTEIPDDRVYLFEHVSQKKYFDINYYDGILTPQYFKEPTEWDGNPETYINLHDADTIIEAVEKYEVENG